MIDHNVFSDLEHNYPEIPNYPQTDGSVKLAAGWLIDQAGWKGTAGGRMVYMTNKHWFL